MDPPPAPVPLRAVRAVLVRPWLWWAAVRTVVRLAPRRWWRRWPPDPRPDPAYLRFRLVTQYGDPAHRLDARDLVTYLEWQRRWPSVAEVAS